MCADVTFNESLPYFLDVSTSRDPILYLPTRVPYVPPVPSPPVKPLQVSVCRNKVVTSPAPVPPASAPSPLCRFYLLLLTLTSFPLFFIRINALVLAIL